MKYTYSNMVARTTTGMIVIIPDQVEANQKQYYITGKSFPVIKQDGSKARAMLNGPAYDLMGSGTGNIVVSII